MNATGYSMLVAADVLGARPGDTLRLELDEAGRPDLYLVRRLSWGDFDIVADALNDGRLQPEHAAPVVQQLRALLTALAQHVRNVEAARGDPGEDWMQALDAMENAYHPDGAGGCACASCRTADSEPLPG